MNKRRFILEDYPGNYAMSCETAHDAALFLEVLDRNEKTWKYGLSYLDVINFGEFKDDTVYFFNEGTYDHINVAYEQGYKVLEFNDFDWSCYTNRDEENT